MLNSLEHTCNFLRFPICQRTHDLKCDCTMTEKLCLVCYFSNPFIIEDKGKIQRLRKYSALLGILKCDYDSTLFLKQTGNLSNEINLPKFLDASFEPKVSHSEFFGSLLEFACISAHAFQVFPKSISHKGREFILFYITAVYHFSVAKFNHF